MLPSSIRNEWFRQVLRDKRIAASRSIEALMVSWPVHEIRRCLQGFDPAPQCESRPPRYCRLQTRGLLYASAASRLSSARLRTSDTLRLHREDKLRPLFAPEQGRRKADLRVRATLQRCMVLPHL